MRFPFTLILTLTTATLSTTPVIGRALDARHPHPTAYDLQRRQDTEVPPPAPTGGGDPPPTAGGGGGTTGGGGGGGGGGTTAAPPPTTAAPPTTAPPVSPPAGPTGGGGTTAAPDPETEPAEPPTTEEETTAVVTTTDSGEGSAPSATEGETTAGESTASASASATDVVTDTGEDTTTTTAGGGSATTTTGESASASASSGESIDVVDPGTGTSTGSTGGPTGTDSDSLLPSATETTGEDVETDDIDSISSGSGSGSNTQAVLPPTGTVTDSDSGTDNTSTSSEPLNTEPPLTFTGDTFTGWPEDTSTSTRPPSSTWTQTSAQQAAPPPVHTAQVVPVDERIEYVPEDAWSAPVIYSSSQGGNGVTTASGSQGAAGSGQNLGACKNETRVSNRVGASLSFKFTGTSIALGIVPGVKGGRYSVRIDNERAVVLDSYKPIGRNTGDAPATPEEECVVSTPYARDGLDDKEHDIKIIIEGPSTQSGSEGGTQLEISGLIYKGVEAIGTYDAKKKNNLPIIIGAAVGGVVFICLIAFLIFRFIVRRRAKETEPVPYTSVSTSATPAPTTMTQTTNEPVGSYQSPPWSPASSLPGSPTMQPLATAGYHNHSRTASMSQSDWYGNGSNGHARQPSMMSATSGQHQRYPSMNMNRPSSEYQQQQVPYQQGQAPYQPTQYHHAQQPSNPFESADSVYGGMGTPPPQHPHPQTYSPPMRPQHFTPPVQPFSIPPVQQQCGSYTPPPPGQPQGQYPNPFA